MDDISTSLLGEEGTAERQDRLASEERGIAEARASVAAGRLIASEDIDAWIDSLGSEDEQPPPPSRR